MADSTNPLETCARLVTYRGFGGDAEAAEAAVAESAWGSGRSGSSAFFMSSHKWQYVRP